MDMSRRVSRQRSCPVYPKPTHGGQCGKSWINTSAERFLEGDREKDRRAGEDKQWRYHPRPRDLVLLRKPVEFPSEPSVAHVDPATTTTTASMIAEGPERKFITRDCPVQQHQCDLRETAFQVQRAGVVGEDPGDDTDASPGPGMLVEHDPSSYSNYYKGPAAASPAPPCGYCSNVWDDGSGRRYLIQQKLTKSNTVSKEASFGEERAAPCCRRDGACSGVCVACRATFSSCAGQRCHRRDRAVRSTIMSPVTSAASVSPSASAPALSARSLETPPQVTKKPEPSTRKTKTGSASFGQRKGTPPRQSLQQRLSHFTAAVGAVCSLLGSPSTVEALYNTSLTFDPPLVGYACEITYSFTPQYSISQGTFIRLALGGFTSGERNGSAGSDVGFASGDDEGNEAMIWPSDTFQGWWSEGTPEAEFKDSLFNIYTMRTLSAGTPYAVVIDRASSLKSNCGHAANSMAFFAWVDDFVAYQGFGFMYYSVEDVEVVPVDCYVTQAELTFDPPLPGKKTHITVAFQLARALTAGDNVTVNLKGFTSGGGDGYPGDDFGFGDLVVSDNSSWLAGWKEGTYVQDESGYEESRLLLRAKTGITAGESHEITVYRNINGLRAQCGVAENATSFTISVVSASYPPWNTTREFDHSQAVGPGCRELNYCSERGECDYCLQRCECPPGFGAASDVVDRNIAADCSERTCPAGVSWAPARLGGGYPRAQPDGSHTLAECSNMGVCIRLFGICECEEGFEGQACERYACPNGCSDRGACRSMRDMAMMEPAMPLVNNNSDTSGSSVNGAEGFLMMYGWGSPAGSETWESRSVFGCVCDSSWEVGLGNGQTQEAEFFGADCSLLHCPSGDDPETDADETDCSNKTAPGGRGVGAEGNKCQVDCSNRGLCDHSTGVCSCFDGYHGQACGMKQMDGYGFNTDGI